MLLLLSSSVLSVLMSHLIPCTHMPFDGSSPIGLDMSCAPYFIVQHIYENTRLKTQKSRFCSQIFVLCAHDLERKNDQDFVNISVI